MYCKTACTTFLFPTGKAFFSYWNPFGIFAISRNEFPKSTNAFSGFPVLLSRAFLRSNGTRSTNKLARMIRSVDINNIFIKITSNGKSGRVKGGVIRSSRVKCLFKFLILIFKSRSFLVTRHCCKKYYEQTHADFLESQIGRMSSLTFKWSRFDLWVMHGAFMWSFLQFLHFSTHRKNSLRKTLHSTRHTGINIKKTNCGLSAEGRLSCVCQ